MSSSSNSPMKEAYLRVLGAEFRALCFELNSRRETQDSRLLTYDLRRIIRPPRQEGRSRRGEAIEALGVAITHSVLVRGGESGVLFEFLQLLLAGVVVDFVGKVR